jgi:hypothetical protein
MSGLGASQMELPLKVQERYLHVVQGHFGFQVSEQLHDGL